MLYQNQKPYTQLIQNPVRGSISIPPKSAVEGEFFARYTSLTPVPDDTWGVKVVFSQTEWLKREIPAYLKPEYQAKGLIPAEEAVPEAVPEETEVEEVMETETEVEETEVEEVMETETEVEAPVKKKGRPKKV